MNTSKHNGIISFWKFMFSMMIVIVHCNIAKNYPMVILQHGYIGVEFFFLVSGYLMTKRALNKKENDSNIGRETWEYIWGKVKVFFPYMLITFIITLLLNISLNLYNIDEIVNSIWNLLFLDISGIRSTLVVGQTWYISAMLISMLILYPLIRKYKKNYIYLIAPAIVIFIGGWISHTYGTINGWDYTTLTYKCLLRAFFELALGTILYELADKISKVNFTKLARIILTLIEIVGFASIFFITNIENANTQYEYIMLLILSTSIVIAFSGKSIFYNFANNKFFYYLEKLSLPIYLNHSWIIIIISNVFANLDYFKVLILVSFTTIIFSMVIMRIIEIIKEMDQPKKVIKKLFIMEN